MKILLVSTGGTIDKIYDPITQSMTFGDSHDVMVSKLWETVVLNHEMYNFAMPLIDSNDMDNDYRQQMIDGIETYGCENVIILHGTDTIVETARYLETNLPSNYSVILTGSYKPSCIDLGSAFFNIGMSFGYLTRHKEPYKDIRICINGEFYSSRNCFKNKKTGLIERK